MAKTRPSIAKRNRERARADKRRQKQAKRGERRHVKQERPEGQDPDYDPDIAGIVPGPQPLPWADELEDEEAAADDDDQSSSPGQTPSR